MNEPFCAFITSKMQLMHLATQVAATEDSIMLHLDATHKLNKAGYNVYVGGFSDRNSRVFPLFFAVCSHGKEEVYLS